MLRMEYCQCVGELRKSTGRFKRVCFDGFEIKVSFLWLHMKANWSFLFCIFFRFSIFYRFSVECKDFFSIQMFFETCWSLEYVLWLEDMIWFLIYCIFTCSYHFYQDELVTGVQFWIMFVLFALSKLYLGWPQTNQCTNEPSQSLTYFYYDLKDIGNENFFFIRLS